MPNFICYSGHRVNAKADVLCRRPSDIDDGMATWLDRLLKALDDAEVSDRYISIRAGLGPSYVFGVRSGKVPTVDKLLKICDVLKISPVYVLTGINARPEDEEFLRAFAVLRPEQRQSVGKMLAAFAPEGESPALPAGRSSEEDDTPSK